MVDTMTATLAELADEILADGIIDADEIQRIRERIFADGKIDREEADFLFGLNDAVSGKANDPGWKALFIEAISKHVLEDEESPNIIDDQEATYLMGKIQADNQVDDVELALLVNLMSVAQSTPSALQAFTLSTLKTAILADGVIDANEVEMLKAVILGTGSGGGTGVDRDEAEFLFELNDAVSGQANDSSWMEFFVEALGKHLLEDENSPGAVDTAEAEWLVSQMEADAKLDDVEKALLSYLKSHASAMPDSLKFKIELWNA